MVFTILRGASARTYSSVTVYILQLAHLVLLISFHLLHHYGIVNKSLSSSDTNASGRHLEVGLASMFPAVYLSE